jgi:hypothetical protein
MKTAVAARVFQKRPLASHNPRGNVKGVGVRAILRLTGRRNISALPYTAT